MIIRAAAKRPEVLALGVWDRQVVDARDASGHEPVVVELPILIAVGSEPVAAVVVPLVRKSDGNTILVKGPELFDQPIVQLLGPLAPEKPDDLIPPDEKFRTISPCAVDRVRHRHFFRISRVPGVFGEPHFRACRVTIEWWNRRA